MAGDLETLLDMGFDKDRAELAVKQSGGLQGAMDWLEKTQDTPLDELKADAEADGPALQPGEEARSLVCNECGKKFRSQAQAEFHASKSEHTDFSESTEEIAPLTEEEKKQKLEDLRARLAAKRSGQSEQDKLDKKRNEEIRRKSTRESQDAKEELAKKQQLKEAAQKKREQQDEIEAKRRIKAKIEADKLARKEKAEREKAAREGRAVVEAQPEAAASAPSKPRAASDYKETRLRLQTSAGTIQHSFPVDATLFEVAHHVQQANGFQAQRFQINFPKKAFTNEDFGMTLKEAGLVPSAALQLS